MKLSLYREYVVLLQLQMSIMGKSITCQKVLVTAGVDKKWVGRSRLFSSGYTAQENLLFHWCSLCLGILSFNKGCMTIAMECLYRKRTIQPTCTMVLNPFQGFLDLQEWTTVVRSIWDATLRSLFGEREYGQDCQKAASDEHHNSARGGLLKWMQLKPLVSSVGNQQ